MSVMTEAEKDAAFAARVEELVAAGRARMDAEEIAAFEIDGPDVVGFDVDESERAAE